MILESYYSLRKKFNIIGLTGRSAAGCSKVAKLLSSKDLLGTLKVEFEDTSEQEVLKQRICNRFIKNNEWQCFTVLKYRDILLLFLLHEGFYKRNNINEGITYLFKLIDGLGSYLEGGNLIKTKTDRLSLTLNPQCFTGLRELIVNNKEVFDFLKDFDFSDKKSLIASKDFNDFYFDKFNLFTENFVNIINRENYFLRCLLLHDIATSLRGRGKIEIDSDKPNIFIIVERLNWILKNHKNHTEIKQNRYVIDSLKNSLESTYFKEKYAAFYMVSINKSDDERLSDLQEKLDEWIDSEDTAKNTVLKEKIIDLDNTEYKSKEVNSGRFSSPDVENCIQKSDYHIFFSNLKRGKFDHYCLENSCELRSLDENYSFLDLNLQLARLLSLMFNPGLITPRSEERLMQVAFTAKLSSGCISRQVGAIVTDDNFSIKSIGWNDVAEDQIPCNLRDFRELRDGKNLSHFSEFERNDGTIVNLNYEDTLSFKEKISDRFSITGDLDALLVNKPCSYCFKSAHNAFEGKDNQVHTRSLHAEENAMLQISKYGGQALKNGYLFTTASPCELCAKKAFQLGLRKIFYIDPYPGISRFHTLKNGVSEDKNPSLIMYQGAIGSGYIRFYHPFISYKDELSITTKIRF